MSVASKKALITGASTGIGAVYADRFSRRGYDLVLVARDRSRLDAVAERLRSESGRKIEVLVADLANIDDLARVEECLRQDEAIDLLVNNAGANQHGGLSALDPDELDGLINLNVRAVTRLVAAVLPRFLSRSAGSIINVASLVALAPEIPFGIYGATKSYVLSLSESLQAELGARGLYVQAVLPGATRTEIWERSGRGVNSLNAVMDVEEMVDAAMVGFDQREPVTIPALGDAGLWTAYVSTRKAIIPETMKSRPADRYRFAS